MASLTNVSIITRKIIRYSIYFVIFIIVARILFNTGKGIFLKIFPPEEPAPTVTFGKLPILPFPEKEKIGNISLTLETASGDLPVLATQTKVFFIPKQSSHLLSLDVAKQKAQALGFLPAGEATNETIYKFISRNSFATLQMNIVNTTFSISYNLKADPSPIERKPQSPEILAAFVRSYLSSANLLPEDLSGPTQNEFLKIEGENIVPALSLSDSNFVKVHLFRKNYENLPTLTNEPKKANVWFMLSGSQEPSKKIVAAEYHYFPIDESQNATYPLKTAQEAWSSLTSGNAYIASYGQNKEGGSVIIRKIYLAYYDPGKPIEFFQPIIVFEGDRDFAAYLPAVTADYYGE
ncbi:hypothetical protein KKC36_00975 [Patescibacteria group bacterium]|nr:hypothetical protein [Patescibacteria group bacterium]